MKRIIYLSCVLLVIVSCKSAHDKMIAKIEAADKQIMADTLMKDDSLAAHQFNNMSEFVAKYPKDKRTPEYLFKSAQLASRLRRAMQSFMLYKQVNDSFPNTEQGAEGMFMMAFMYENNFQNTDRAKEYYSRFIAKYPNNALVKDAKASLDMLNSGKSIEEMVKEWEAKADTAKKS